MKPEDVIGIYDREGVAWAATRDRRLAERPWLDRGCQVTGVDASRPMIELFARVVPRAVALHADMRTLRLSQDFDLVIAWDSYFHLSPEDQRAMFPVFANHMGKGSVMLVTTGPQAGEAIGRIGEADLYHASLAPEEYRRLFEEHGFEELGYWPEEPACGGRTIWMARRI